MKKSVRLLLCALLTLAVLAIAACNMSGGKYEFSGTWSFTAPIFGTSSWQFGDTGGSATVNIVFSYTITFDYVAVDEAANHIDVNITSSTGLGPSVGPAYITYSISGSDIMIGISNSLPYPSPLDGPFSR